MAASSNLISASFRTLSFRHVEYSITHWNLFSEIKSFVGQVTCFSQSIHFLYYSSQCSYSQTIANSKRLSSNSYLFRRNIPSPLLGNNVVSKVVNLCIYNHYTKFVLNRRSCAKKSQKTKNLFGNDALSDIWFSPNLKFSPKFPDANKWTRQVSTENSKNRNSSRTIGFSAYERDRKLPCGFANFPFWLSLRIGAHNFHFGDSHQISGSNFGRSLGQEEEFQVEEKLLGFRPSISPHNQGKLRNVTINLDNTNWAFFLELTLLL